MPTLGEYRRSVAVESGPYIGPESYEVRATSGSSTTQLVCSAYPIRSGIPQTDLYVDRPLYRPNAIRDEDKNRYIMEYDPESGTLTPDLVWLYSPLSEDLETSYEQLEAYTYHDLEFLTYEQMENTSASGIGERFEVLGPFDAPTLHQLINDGLKQCWMVVEVACIPTPNASPALAVGGLAVAAGREPRSSGWCAVAG